jgi:hypothetical protein
MSLGVESNDCRAASPAVAIQLLKQNHFMNVSSLVWHGSSEKTSGLAVRPSGWAHLTFCKREHTPHCLGACASHFQNLRCALASLVKGGVLAGKVKTRLRFQNFGYRQCNEKRSRKRVKNRVFIGVFEDFLVSWEEDGCGGNAISFSLAFGRTFGLRGQAI